MKKSIQPIPENVRKVCLDAELLFQKWQIPEKISYDMVLSLDEALTNIIEHGFSSGNENDQLISVEITYQSMKVIIIIRDSARKFNLNNIADTKTDGYLESGQIGGFGVSIMRKLMDDVKLSYLDNQNVLWMSKTVKMVTESYPEFISTLTADGFVENRILVIRTHSDVVIDIEDSREHMESYFKLIEHYPEKKCNAMLVDARGIKILTKKARQFYITYPHSGIDAIAILIKSIFSRWVANIFISLNKDPDQEIRLFNSETEARIWLDKVAGNQGNKFKFAGQ